ncbi:Hypothetical predicted protein [Paramuricea clavata]|uniref:Uncharacterized protein n=1 Tax=Paramuricea clavata TaxID=317549 RepID=A0A6S7GKF4_PARCT|nr:Hypothetical predicted protein [Paramuricea clavata]
MARTLARVACTLAHGSHGSHGSHPGSHGSHSGSHGSHLGSHGSLARTILKLNEIESIQRRALKIIYPDLSYADALDTTGFDILIDRRGDACKSTFCNPAGKYS